MKLCYVMMMLVRGRVQNDFLVFIGLKFEKVNEMNVMGKYFTVSYFYAKE